MNLPKAKLDKDLAKGLNALNKAAHKISDKFVDADRRKFKNPMDCEMFIVEGDSAGGSAKKCRDKKYQGLLPLRGKPKNISNDAEDAFMKCL